MSACKACHATILWATTPAGKAVPLDPNPRDDGNLTITSQVPLRVRYLDADVFPDLPRYVLFDREDGAEHPASTTTHRLPSHRDRFQAPFDHGVDA